jgi:hypothetical protein
MIPDDDIRIDMGRARNGSFTRMVHIPTGIQRIHPGPLKGVDLTDLYARWRAEIEEELDSRVTMPTDRSTPPNS